MTTLHTHHLTWITMGESGTTITTPIGEGLDAHLKAVAVAVADYPDDENGQRPDLNVSDPFIAIAYKDLPDEKVDAALNGSDSGLQHLGHEQFGETWYGKDVDAR